MLNMVLLSGLIYVQFHLHYSYIKFKWYLTVSRQAASFSFSTPNRSKIWPQPQITFLYNICLIMLLKLIFRNWKEHKIPYTHMDKHRWNKIELKVLTILSTAMHTPILDYILSCISNAIITAKILTRRRHF